MASSIAHPSAVGTNTQPKRSTVSSTETPTQAAPEASTDDSQLPPQRHAGALGLGPAYGQGAGLGEKLGGLQEEIKGKIMKKPELVEHGRERRTGILKKKEQEQNDEEDPFAKPEN
ncbi:hypothetical protein DEU56DRAFT_534996 [Suillus clintonianus]|uniref:uncharacterized protein n=1 Tax=Suillus clintonianus TaxID=1904413 RepID=UPI001B88330E|nr:uncharacterized protein DEU56DRAFT_534996 [Suillus clintonianus]KAG2126937.1 hypothetical protein DEU56DRAFT_534996 [Suillus clintonianus]